MLELALDARRGSFHLQVECRSRPSGRHLGPSGAGKSTLLRLLAGLDRARHDEPVRGRVHFDGAALTERQRTLARARPSPHRARRAAARALPSPQRGGQCGLWTAPASTAPAAPTASTRCWHWSTQRSWPSAVRRISPAARRSAWPWRGPWHPALGCCCSMSRSPRSTALPATRCSSACKWLRQNRVQTVLATHDVTDAFATGAEVMLLREGRLAALGPAEEVLAAERQRLLGRLGSS